MSKYIPHPGESDRPLVLDDLNVEARRAYWRYEFAGRLMVDVAESWSGEDYEFTPAQAASRAVVLADALLATLERDES